jgi:hypothetical protein
MRLKNDVHLRIVVNQQHLHKLQSVGIKNISEVIRRCIDYADLESLKKNEYKSIIDIPIDYKDWVITITNDDDVNYKGFAMPLKFAHIYNANGFFENQYGTYIEECLNKNCINIDDFEGYSFYEFIERFNESTNWLMGVNCENPYSILNGLKKEIDENEKHNIKFA